MKGHFRLLLLAVICIMLASPAMAVLNDTSETTPTPTLSPQTDYTLSDISTSDSARSSVQSLESSANPWIQQTANAGWGSRYYHSSVVMPDDSIVLMGGFVTDSLKSDVWRSTDKGVTWTLKTQAAGWSARWFHHSSVTMSDGNIVLIGGSGFGSTFVNDVWRSTDNGATWTQMTNVPWLARSAHTSVALSDDSIVMMGGASDEPYHDVWLSSDEGATWQRQTADAGWMERFRFAAVALPDDSIVIMGGATDYGHKNDVWLSTDKGASWTRMTSAAGWSPRECHTAVALPNGDIILMGGFDDNSAKNDVWMSTDKGASWTRLPDAGWSSRGGHTSVSLSDGSVVLMGGGKSDVWRLPQSTPPAPEMYTFSISNAKWDDQHGAIDKNAIKDCERMEQIFNDLGWKEAFPYKEGADVTKGTFGVNPISGKNTLNEAILHYHVGHGGIYSNDLYKTYIMLLYSDMNEYALDPSEIQQKWGGKNKWVILSSCYLLRDGRWVTAMGTTHGILGFSTITYAHPDFMATFIGYAKTESVRDAYFDTVYQLFKNTWVDTADGRKKGEHLTAKVYFGNSNQAKNDYLPSMVPGKGIQPDALPTDPIFEYQWPQQSEVIVA